jgi:hypothetical protein
MSLDPYAETDGHVTDQAGSPSRIERLLRKLFGDPRSAPSRIAKVVLFGFISVVTLGVWAIVYQNVDSSGSSYWFFRTVIGLLQSWWLPPVISLYLYYKYIGLRRQWAVRKAANMTGWLRESIVQLSDEMRSSDFMHPVIVTSDMTRSEIEEFLDKALDGESHDAESIDYWSVTDAGQDKDPKTGDSETPALESKYDRETVVEAAANAEHLAAHLHDELAESPDSKGDPSEDAGELETPADTEVGEVLSRVRGLFSRSTESSTDSQDTDSSGSSGWGADPFADSEPVDPTPSPQTSDDSRRDDAAAVDESEIPWRIAIAEEFKQFSLHISAAFESGALLWRLGLPYVIAAAAQLVYLGLWVAPLTGAVVLFGTSPLIALATFHGLSKLRSQRIKRHRQPTKAEYWDAQMALVKTVETPDVTCYMGRAAGRAYASYDREEFIEEFAQRLWEMTTEHEEVSPSVMEQYARNLKQMKPNLPGHLVNIEIPSINREIKTTVEGETDEIVTKSKLAYEVITNAADSRFGRNLGHDPALVRERYRGMVEDEHSLAETTLTTETASGEEVELTLVYPADKRRLPEMSQMQSRFSERFMGAHGEPIYELPEVNPTEDLRGVNVPDRAYEMMPDPPELPSGDDASPAAAGVQSAD